MAPKRSVRRRKPSPRAETPLNGQNGEPPTDSRRQGPTLPAELLRNIVEEVALSHWDSNARRRDLHNLLFVSRDFKNEAERLLFRDIRVISGKPAVKQISSALALHARARLVHFLRIDEYADLPGRRGRSFDHHFFSMPLHRMDCLRSLSIAQGMPWMPTNKLFGFLANAIPENTLIEFRTSTGLYEDASPFLSRQNMIKDIRVSFIGTSLTEALCLGMYCFSSDDASQFVQERPVSVLRLASLYGLPTYWNSFQTRLQVLDLSRSIYVYLHVSLWERIQLLRKSTDNESSDFPTALSVEGFVEALGALRDLAFLETLTVDNFGLSWPDAPHLPRIINAPQLKRIFVTQKSSSTLLTNSSITMKVGFVGNRIELEISVTSRCEMCIRRPMLSWLFLEVLNGNKGPVFIEVAGFVRTDEILNVQRPTLPPELLRLIVEEVASSHWDSNARRRELYNLLFVSRTFRDEAERLLFRNIQLTSETPVLSQFSNALKDRTRLVHSLRVDGYADLPGRRGRSSNSHLLSMPLHRMDCLRSLSINLAATWIPATQLFGFLKDVIQENTLVEFRASAEMDEDAFSFLNRQKMITHLQVPGFPPGLHHALLQSPPLLPRLQHLILFRFTNSESSSQFLSERPISILQLGTFHGLPGAWSSCAARLQVLDVSKFSFHIEAMSTGLIRDVVSTAINLRFFACFSLFCLNTEHAKFVQLVNTLGNLHGLALLETLTVKIGAPFIPPLDVLDFPGLINAPKLKRIFVTQNVIDGDETAVSRHELCYTEDGRWVCQVQQQDRDQWFSAQISRC
ncbi:hypothetical protein SISNIDRAFT_494362 [Sistotremastrum niveocremeum HHB9708]|uniref:F-box domain-containing protein n=1 Tax=Sistotremastrum niveocremeum HHB9708 TaxID=1314777 RepID=A0A164WX50_9AGAM|nr:hypothetical protein SISNIDRAFT_494362 [Sistotremastrum niveocremeum HHB9708]